MYAYSDLKAAVNGRIHNQIGRLANARVTLNNAVKEVLGDIDLRSTKRKATLAPNLFQDVFDYTWPTDGKGLGIIDLAPQVDRSKNDRFDLTTEEEFDARKSFETGLVAFTDRDFTRKLRVAALIDDQTLIVSTLDALTAGGGTWSATGDATSLAADSDNYVKGNGALKFNLNSGATTAGIQNTSLSTFDLTDYVNQGSVFVWVYINAITGITSFTLRLGNNTSNYYSQTVTTTNEGLAFQAGWNLLRFDLNGATQTGTVTLTTCAYAAVFMTKTVGKAADNGYRFDHIMVKRGKYYNLIYYSKYLWQTAAGVYIVNSTLDTDLLNVDEEEYNLLIEKCVELAAEEVREYGDADRAAKKYLALKKTYEETYPSEAMTMTTTYHDFASLSGDDDTFGGTA